MIYAWFFYAYFSVFSVNLFDNAAVSYETVKI